MRRSRSVPRPGRRSRRASVIVAFAAAAALIAPAATSAAPRTNADLPAAASAVTDYCGGQCSDILPPGENGNETLAQILLFKVFGTRPTNNNDQLAPYSNLVSSYTGLTDSQIDTFYNSSALGVPANQVQRVERPESGVTIVRDTSGIPHIYGDTRAEGEFGAGYAGAEDRLWVMDLMRHLGRAELTSFAGGAPANRTLEQNLWQTAPYTEADLQAQVNALASDGTQGAQVKSDIDSYLAGVNGYIAQVKAADDFPGEYDLTGQSMQPFTETDMIAIAGVVGGLFGSGGGEAMQSALVKEAAEAEYGVSRGDQVWSALREQNDPEATLTLHNGQSFPYGEPSGTPVAAAMPDPGTVTPITLVQNATGSAAASAAKRATAAPKAGSAALTKLAAKVPASLRSQVGAVNGMFDSGAMPGVDMPAPGQQHPGMSNALVVSGSESASGHPIAVFGPQTGYFAPQLLMLEEIQAPGLSARGVAFSGLNFYVEMGRGPSYAWSATSGEQGTADTFAVKLCNTDGSPATSSSTSYLDNGVCTPMQKLEQTDSWSPTVADGTAAGSYDLVMYRTAYGLVDDTGEVDGAPVAYTVQRATYMHEAVSAIGFEMFNDPSVMATPAGFESAAAQVGYDFNWFYVNSTDTAYFNSGLNPVRASGTDPDLPIWGTPADEWVGWNTATDTSEDTPPTAHPNATDQNYFVSWNNKQALNYSAADGNFSYGPVQRVDLLDQGISSYLASGAKFTRAALVQVMEQAAVTDLRGKEVLPLLLRVIDSQPVTDPAQQALVTELTTWLQAGATITPTSAGATSFQNSAAIQLMDAWWPLLVQAEFEPGMGSSLFTALSNDMQVNDSPSGGQQIAGSGAASSNQAQPHKGSAFQYGWWGYVSKDLRGVLGQPVQDPLPLAYCGNGGGLAACRTALLTSLSAAAAEPAATVYPADAYCSAGDQWCADSIIQDPLGGITDPGTTWQNRPTFQQVVEFPSGP
ncbi:penicillin acylase family protein [Streptacidiphilus sp. PB12-B1b]|uniref:penicillin acylase family protein n=1 Tax=Streptacidiphilus sp. PB12-B1b TaxID=2705012 RepID=UPI0015FC8346|nr:penicillin acylase family protein [Streptacidiphilus sp. PB12-B1b]QMU77358.1 penicillin acylase family protein [Streptacidiphilus sp. PB12-B1b]